MTGANRKGYVNVAPQAPNQPQDLGDARFRFPTAIAVDSHGDLYVCDRGNNAIRMIRTSGGIPFVITIAGNGEFSGSGPFDEPYGIAVTADGSTVYVADTGNGSVRKLARPASGFDWAVSTLASGFGTPVGVAVDRQGNVYVTDNSANGISVTKVDPRGVKTSVVGMGAFRSYNDGDAMTGEFHSAWGIAVDAQGTLFVADSGNHAIRRFGAPE